jgi:AcrR family transcriptional regulator
MESFARRGYEATSLDVIAKNVGISKQSILYWYPSKEDLLMALIDRSANELTLAMEEALALPTQLEAQSWSKIEAVVKAVFRVGVRRPDLIGLVREVSRLGPPASSRLIENFDPLLTRAYSFMQEEIARGAMKRHEPRFILLATYSMVVGMITEVELLRALGEEPSIRSLVRRRSEVLEFLKLALLEP